METNTFAMTSLHQVLTMLIFILLATSTICSACTNSTISTSSTQTNKTNTTIPSNSMEITFRTYIKTSCNSTTYPSICYKSLSPYASKIEADPMKLCNASLSLALKAARSANSTISNILQRNNLTDIEKQVVQDCSDNVKYSMGQLQDSVDAMGHLDGFDKEFQISNIKTWMSAAITNDQTCSDGFDDMNGDATLRDKIRKIVLNAARMNSNALYFVNNLIY